MSNIAFTYKTLAERWACSEALLYAMVRRGELRTFRVGKATRISAAEVARIEGSASNDPTARQGLTI